MLNAKIVSGLLPVSVCCFAGNASEFEKVSVIVAISQLIIQNTKKLLPLSSLYAMCQCTLDAQLSLQD